MNNSIVKDLFADGTLDLGAIILSTSPDTPFDRTLVKTKCALCDRTAERSLRWLLTSEAECDLCGSPLDPEPVRRTVVAMRTGVISADEPFRVLDDDSQAPQKSTP